MKLTKLTELTELNISLFSRHNTTVICFNNNAQPRSNLIEFVKPYSGLRVGRNIDLLPDDQVPILMKTINELPIAKITIKRIHKHRGNITSASILLNLPETIETINISWCTTQLAVDALAQCIKKNQWRLCALNLDVCFEHPQLDYTQLVNSLRGNKFIQYLSVKVTRNRLQRKLIASIISSLTLYKLTITSTEIANFNYLAGDIANAVMSQTVLNDLSLIMNLSSPRGLVSDVHKILTTVKTINSFGFRSSWWNAQNPTIHCVANVPNIKKVKIEQPHVSIHAELITLLGSKSITEIEITKHYALTNPTFEQVHAMLESNTTLMRCGYF
jgi:hypothetical protein